MTVAAMMVIILFLISIVQIATTPPTAPTATTPLTILSANIVPVWVVTTLTVHPETTPTQIPT